MNIKTTDFVFHHIGIPTTEKRAGEKFSPIFKMYTSGGENSEFRVQYHRFEADSPLHPLLKTMTHVAFLVPNLEKAIVGRDVVLGPYEPIKGFKVACLIDSGSPIELIETTLSEEEIWLGSHDGSYLYPAE
jgi:hypothetical protein